MLLAGLLNKSIFCFQIFDQNWHKLDFSVNQEEVLLHMDCGDPLALPLQAVGPIDVNGFTHLAVNAETEETALVI